jgi:hypothetical protein
MNVSDLIGKTFVSIQGASVGSDTITLTADDGKQYRFFHEEDCCESVKVEDITGDPGDLLRSPLLMAEEVSNAEGDPRPHEYADSWTWTFYKLATVKGYVTIRWLGESNGYYGESVSLVEVGHEYD